MMAVSRPNQFRDQDGHIVLGTHAQARWNRRIEAAWIDYPVRAAWREGEPAVTPKTDRENYCRVHLPSGAILTACYGYIHTVTPVCDCSRGARRSIADQLGITLADLYEQPYGDTP